MALQLQYVLAGERMRAGEEQQQALVDHFAIVVVPGAVVGVARLGFQAGQADADGARTRAGHAHDADAPATLGSGDGGYGFTGAGHAGVLGCGYLTDSKTPHEGASCAA